MAHHFFPDFWHEARESKIKNDPKPWLLKKLLTGQDSKETLAEGFDRFFSFMFYSAEFESINGF